MKAAWGRTVSGLSSFTRGTYNVLTLSRLRNSQPVTKSDTDGTKDQELDSINGATSSQDKSSRGASLCTSYTPPPNLLPVITQEDDILYRKNNVCLKCQIGAAARKSNSSASPDSSLTSPAVQCLRALSSRSTSPQPPPTEQKTEKVPGFLFIASRGSNYGSTLILNWAPNSMIQCSVSINASAQTAGEASDNQLTSSSESERSLTEAASASSAPPNPTASSSSSSSSAATRVEHKCVSIDLGEMEVIRVFYQSDESGCIVSGEMVVSSKQTNFWVFRFQNGGLTDLIHLFCSWKYFSHHEHRYMYCTCTLYMYMHVLV